MTSGTVFRRRAWSTNVLIREPAEVYHAKAKTFLSSHRLAEFRRNPPLFRMRELGLLKEEDRPAYVIGRAAHTLILEGREAYERAYAFGGPVNARTGAPFGSRSKAYAEWASMQGKPVLDDEQAALVENLNSAVRAHEEASALLAGGVAEGVIRTEYCGIPCQARIDWVNPQRGIIDLKSCEDVDCFELDARRFGYQFQLAFYRSLLACVVGDTLPVFLIGIEKKVPCRCGVWSLAEGLLGAAKTENERAIERLKVCRDKDTWPSGYESIRKFDWM